MSNQTQKKRSFLAGPMGQKKVTDIPGIGPVLGKRLSEKGYDKASALFVEFLKLDQDEKQFTDWLKETCGANSQQSLSCYGCFKEWYFQYM